MDLVNFAELVEAKFLRARHASVGDVALQVMRERKMSFADVAKLIPLLSTKLRRLGIDASDIDPNLYVASTFVRRVKQFVAAAMEMYLTTKYEYIAEIHANRRGIRCH